MAKHVFRYVGPGGKVYANDDVLPLGALRSVHATEGPFFRFCLEPDSNTFRIQDESFRRRLAGGERDAWDMLNEALAWAEKSHGMRFPTRAFGDPTGSSVKRKLSQYKKAWDYLRSFSSEEFGVEAPDLPVVEYAAAGDDENLVYQTAGKLMINRNMHRLWKETGKALEDVDYDLINDELTRYVMANATNLGMKWESQPTDAYFACRVGGEPRMFQRKGEDEDEIRQRAGIPKEEAVLLFSLRPATKEMCLENCMPSFVRDNDEDLMKAMIKKVASHFGVVPDGVMVTFDSAMSRPFVSKLSRYSTAWEVIRELGWPAVDLPVVASPMRGASHAASIVRDPAEEERLLPGMERYRVTRGLDVRFPYLAVRGGAPRGEVTRGILEEYSKVVPDAKDELSRLKPREFMLAVRDPKNVERVGRVARHMRSIGMDDSEILDTFSGYDDLLRRAEYRRLLRPGTRMASRTADMGPGLGINEWWHIGLQEDLNRAQHQDNKKKAPKKMAPYNRKRRSPIPMEGLLEDKRDREMPAQKSTEQLLRENRI